MTVGVGFEPRAENWLKPKTTLKPRDSYDKFATMRVGGTARFRPVRFYWVNKGRDAVRHLS